VLLRGACPTNQPTRLRRHLEAQRNYKEKLGAVKTALDAWLTKAQANYRCGARVAAAAAPEE
jgi:hypothetical protein